MNAFSLGGEFSEDYGIIMTAPPDLVTAERDVERFSVSGRNGDLVVDKGRYKNVTISYKCAVVPSDGEDYREMAIHVAELLRPACEYQRLENTYDPWHFRMARVSSQVSIESIVEQAGKFTVNFDCKPQRFLVSGESKVTYESAGTIVNPTSETAIPLITVYGTEAGEVSVAGVTVQIKEIQDQITLDCDIQDAYRQVADSGPENCNGKIYAPEFPVLQPGVNGISFTGGITKVEIIPRWWTL